MQSRRSVLAGLAASLTGVGAGCAAITGGLEVTSADAESTFAGNVEIVAIVMNHSSDQQSGTLVGEVDLESGDTHTSRTQITVAGDAESPKSITVDLPIAEALSGNAYQYSAEID